MMNSSKRTQKQKGFTMVELMIVLTMGVIFVATSLLSSIWKVRDIERCV
ncbi:TPA: hypothetical protein DCW61_03765 [Candidatus Uhrbacteria bacterium]|nr:hypothetical protein [Candidatus Uhrbacteria bacterium]